ncbi:MAG: M48 family metalloprotease [Syntrophales bacterium]|nr:M48 family metalloprotease [Syntrophales bacterium]MDD5532135.1 M48 family metalloprotease [Syntrophales bacterium]
MESLFRNKPARRRVLFCRLLIILPVIIGVALLARPADASFSIDDENKLGKEIHQKIEGAKLLFHDVKSEDYINRLGRKILAQSGTPSFDFRFFILNSSAINAFATPGGYVYINRGLIGLVDNESELAGVIAHEIAHVNCRHIARNIEKSQKIGMASLAAIVAGILLGGGTGTEAVLGLSMATASHMQLAYSRENEEEADRLGISYLAAAGYSGRGMLTFMKTMKNYEFYSSSIPSYFLSHPGTDERIRYLDALIESRYKSGGKLNILGGLPRVKSILVLEEKDPSVAERYFAGRLKRNPKDLEGLFGISVVRSRKGQTEEALAGFRKALAVAPSDVDVIRQLGLAYLKAGRTVDAVNTLRQAYMLQENDYETLLQLARGYDELGDYKTSLDLFLKYRKRYPGDDQVLYAVAMNYGRTGNPGESHYHFGLYFKKKSKSESALFHFREALKHPSSPGRTAELDREIESLQKVKKSLFSKEKAKR